MLLNASAHDFAVAHNPLGFQAFGPNTPVMPFATPSKKASFIDPTVSIKNGNSVVLGFQDFIGPYATLDGRGGAIKIGNGSDVLDNASIVANPVVGSGIAEVLIGNSVVIGFGAKVIGPSTIGSYADSTQAGLDRRQRRDRRRHHRARRDRLAAGPCRPRRDGAPRVTGCCPVSTSRPTPRRRTPSWGWLCPSRRPTSRRS